MTFCAPGDPKSPWCISMAAPTGGDVQALRGRGRSQPLEMWSSTPEPPCSSQPAPLHPPKPFTSPPGSQEAEKMASKSPEQGGVGGCGGSGVPGCLHPLSAAFPDLLHLKSGKGAIKAPWALAGRSVIVHLHARERMSNGSRHEGGITEPDYPTPALLPLPLSICLCGGLWDPSVQPCSGGHGKCTKDREQTKIYFCWPSHLITVRPQRYVPC